MTSGWVTEMAVKRVPMSPVWGHYCRWMLVGAVALVLCTQGTGLRAAEPEPLTATMLVSPSKYSFSSAEPRCASDRKEKGTASCAEVCVRVPSRARIADVKPYVREYGETQWIEVVPGEETPIGWSRFERSYEVYPSKKGSKDVCWQFLNWDVKRTREAKIEVLIEP